jgi:hypothetical protein
MLRPLIVASALLMASCSPLTTANPLPVPSPEQLALLDGALAKDRTALDKTERLLEQPENEGLALEAVRRARAFYDADPQDGRAVWLVHALSYRATRHGKFKVDGPYLKELTKILWNMVERELPRETGWGLQLDYRPLIAYLQRHPNDPLRERILPTALRYAKVPVPPAPGEVRKDLDVDEQHRLWNRTRFAWQTLFALSILYEGMDYTEANRVLSSRQPQAHDHVDGAKSYEGQVGWAVPTQFRRRTGLSAVIRDGKCFQFYGYH